MKAKLLAAKIALILGVATIPAHAGIPTIDGANILQTTITAFESIAQTMKQVEQYQKQIEQYQTQLQQYENMLQNTLAPAAYIWDQAQATMNKLIAAQNTLAFYQNRLGSLDNYLAKFQDVAYYRSSPCFSNTGCTEAEWAAMNENRRLANESQKKANDALFKSIDAQHKNMKNDARTLERLQSAAQGAEGQLQAIGYANQLASQQANQLLQMRTMMTAQHAVLAAKAQAEADIDAKQQAAHAQSTEPRIKNTTNPTNWLNLSR